MRKDVVHVYPGTQGSGGLYTDEIYTNLNELGYTQEVFVSYYFPFSYGKKIFFKYSDLVSGAKKTWYRMYIRGLELLYGLIYIYVYVLFKRARIINYSLNSSYISDLAFIWLLKKTTNATVIITCHDVLPMAESDKLIAKQTKIRASIFKLADKLLVHNNNSILDLSTYFAIPESKILFHYFPLMDLSKVVDTSVNKSPIKYDFGFIGHLRNNKGVNVLLEAWKLFHQQYPKAILLMAGNLPDGSELNLDGYEALNINLRLQYLSDKDYYKFVTECETMILPYVSGTNSGVVYNLVPLEKKIIFSDLPMFTNNPLLNQNGVFATSDPKSLMQTMVKFYKKNADDVQPNIEQYRIDFKKQICSAYLALNKMNNHDTTNK